MNAPRSVSFGFSLRDVVTLVSHAVSADSHIESLYEPRPDVPFGPALILCGDDGIYLMSNGVPYLPAIPGEGTWGNMRVHAYGFEAGSLHMPAINGQVLADHIPMDAELHEALTRGLRDGRNQFQITISADKLTCNMVTGKEI